MNSEEQLLSAHSPRHLWIQAAGLALFLFIPAVLFLFVVHPAPVGASLAAGAALILGHRLLARPYMRRALPLKCVWCNRSLPATLDASTRTIDLADLASGSELLPARCCAAHRAPAARFFAFLRLARAPLLAGIFVPLFLLLAALLAAACGWERPLPAATALFQLAIGLTVSAAAWGYRLVREPDSRSPLALPFPAHNFFLLGVRALLWIFRLVGAWWIYSGLLFWVQR
ncbi:MAG TPA: hypothetical protein VHR45_24850 [Thermoanaerobaculia bacterium]|nr:hypothetical protein [Thermoanaerobaculia bacterium]